MQIGTIGTRVKTTNGTGEIVGWLISRKKIVKILVRHDWLGDPKPAATYAYEPGQVRPLDQATLEVAHVSKNHSHR